MLSDDLPLEATLQGQPHLSLCRSGYLPILDRHSSSSDSPDRSRHNQSRRAISSIPKTLTSIHQSSFLHGIHFPGNPTRYRGEITTDNSSSSPISVCPLHFPLLLKSHFLLRISDFAMLTIKETRCSLAKRPAFVTTSAPKCHRCLSTSYLPYPQIPVCA